MNWELEYDLPSAHRFALMSLKTTLMLVGMHNQTYNEHSVEQICRYALSNPDQIELMETAAKRGPSNLQELLSIMDELQTHHVAVMDGAL